MKKGFKYQICRNGHPYSLYGIIRQGGKDKGMQRCKMCWMSNNDRNNGKRRKK